jgi:NitT/TauT family transport system permease protein
MNTAIDRLRRRSKHLGDVLLLLAILAAVWQGLYEIVGSVGMSPPIGTAVNAYRLLASPTFWPNAATTLEALGISLVLEIAAGLVVGLALGLNRAAGEVVEPMLILFYAVPKVVFYPIILMFCGIGLASEVVFAVLHGILPIILFTMNAVRAIKMVFLKTARMLRFTQTQVMLRVALPATLPEVFTGLRVGFSATLLGVLFSEMFGSKSGLGFLLMNAIGLNRVSEIMSLTLLFTVFAVAANSMMLAVDHRLHRRV